MVSSKKSIKIIHCHSLWTANLFTTLFFFLFIDTGKQSAAVIGGATAAGGVGLVGIIALAAVFVKYRILQLMTNKIKVRDMHDDTTQDEQMSRRSSYIQDDDIVERDAESQNS